MLGGLWAIIQPVAATVLFTVFFGRLGGLSQHVSGSYALFVYIGLSLWTFYANAITLAANSLVGSSHLIAKVYFPRLLIPVAAICLGPRGLRICLRLSAGPDGGVPCAAVRADPGAAVASSWARWLLRPAQACSSPR